MTVNYINVYLHCTVLPVPYLAFTAVGFVFAHRITIGLKIQTFDRDQPFQEGCLA